MVKICMYLANFCREVIVLHFQVKLVIGCCESWEAADDHIIIINYYLASSVIKGKYCISSDFLLFFQLCAILCGLRVFHPWSPMRVPPLPPFLETLLLNFALSLLWCESSPSLQFKASILIYPSPSCRPAGLTSSCIEGPVNVFVYFTSNESVNAS